MNEDELSRSIEELIIDQKRLQRKHASFFYGGRKYKKETELFIAEEFVLTFERIFKLKVSDVLLGDDPPDIVFKVGVSEKFAVELTELVNQQAIISQIKNDQERYTQEHLNWDSKSTCEHIERLLFDKQKTAQRISHMYKRYMVLIHTDETMLTSDQIASFTCDHSWPEYPDIDDAFVLCSYESSSGYPVIKLFGT